MKNIEVIREFVKLLIENPSMTILAVNKELLATDYEVRLLQADPVKATPEREIEALPQTPGVW